MVKQNVWMLVLVGCGSAAQPTTVGNSSTVAAPTGYTPAVELVTPAEWEACTTCDEQQLEGGVPLRFVKFPAVTRGGDLIAVVEDRDGWGHVPVPGVRLLDRTGATVKWLPVDGQGVDPKTAVAAANAELGKHAWLALETPVPTVKETGDQAIDSELTLGAHRVRYHQRHDGDVHLPPSEISVLDANGKVVTERRDTETAWQKRPACNLPKFAFVGASEAGGVVVFATTLGMGGHNCDGVEQRPAWHVLAFR